MRTVVDERRARFEAMVEAVYEPLQRYARRRTDVDSAQDLVADTLLVLWRRLDDVPAGAALPWCYRVAANSLGNARRGARRRARLLARVAAVDPPRSAADAESSVDEADPAVHAALAALTPSDRELLRLWAWEQLAPGEIAVALDVAPSVVSVRLHRAKQRLAAHLAAPTGSDPGKDDLGPGHTRGEEQEEVR